MIIKSWREYLKIQKEKYKKMVCIECPVFNDEKIYFNRYGFDHIVYKNGIPRPQGEVVRRFGLLPYLPNALRNTKNISSGEERIKNKSTACFWAIEYKVDGSLKLRIIIRRLNNGKLHFFSIMDD